MFTGVVAGTGEVRAVEETADGRRLRIGTGPVDDLAHGASVAVSGVCLTVEEYGDDWFDVFLAAETVERTYLGDVAAGDPVNLERALRADGRLDGHFVQGHVDAVATVTGVESVGEDWRYAFEAPDEWARYLVEKGSVALDGISLTVASLGDGGRFEVAVVPATHDLTTLSAKAPGDPVHFEADVLAKYVERLAP